MRSTVAVAEERFLKVHVCSNFGAENHLGRERRRRRHRQERKKIGQWPGHSLGDLVSAEAGPIDAAAAAAVAWKQWNLNLTASRCCCYSLVAAVVVEAGAVAAGGVVGQFLKKKMDRFTLKVSTIFCAASIPFSAFPNTVCAH